MRSHDRILYATVCLVARMAGLFPFGAMAVFGRALGLLAGRVFRIRRAHVLEAMRRAGIEAAPRQADRMYASLGASLCELVWLSARPKSSASEFAELAPASADELRRLIERGRGVVIAASHTGNWDLAACVIAHEVPLSVVTKRLSVRALDSYWQRTRARRGVRLHDAHGALRDARGVLAAGGAVAMMVDQVPPSRRHAIAAQFLGASCLVDRAPFALAAQAGAPVVVAASRRTPSGRQELVALCTLEPNAASPRGWVDEAARVATEALERFVRENPSEWLWLHRRWGEPRTGRGHGAISGHARLPAASVR